MMQILYPSSMLHASGDPHALDDGGIGCSIKVPFHPWFNLMLEARCTVQSRSGQTTSRFDRLGV